MDSAVLNEKRLLSPEKLAEYLDVSRKTIYRWAVCGIIPCVRLGKSLRFDKAEIDQWIEGKKDPGSARFGSLRMRAYRTKGIM
ncbi:MAG: helix-turn-helix domain-containing protein [Elusimicrobia bacterium]|nr:helix-turn-helix domain-containing protein [Elusimicrobiota bacterium]